MGFVFTLISLMILANVGWWWRARAWARVRSRALRIGITAWAVFNLSVLVGVMFGRLVSPGFEQLIPRPLIAASSIWHLLILPVTLVAMGAEGVARGFVALVRLWTRKARPAKSNETSGEPSLSRRHLLGGAIASIPPLVTVLTTGRAMATLDEFRVRRLDVVLPRLPRDLDGLSIAHVTDVHVGRFTTATILPKIAEATNVLKPDLVLMTGDLINISIDDLPAGLDMVRRLDPRHGLFTCEGNHDLISNPFRFEEDVKASGVPLLLNELAPITVNGHPVDVMGLRWTRNRGGYSAQALNDLNARRRPDAFPILLSHHPHSFDQAAALGIPLTLSGHTHGGQLHFSEHIGFGPLMYRYWSGLYRKNTINNESLVVSNGVGNWFPLRVNAPAEIVHVVLHRA